MKLTRTDVKNIVSLNKARNLTYIEIYKKFFMRCMDRQVELDRKKDTAWMANISSPTTYMICMWVFWMYQDSKVAFEVYKTIKKKKWEELTDEEKEKTEEKSNAFIVLFENIYEESDWSDEFDRSVLDAIIVGNGFWGIWYELSEDTYEVTWKNWVKETITEKTNIPNVYRILPLNFFTELSAPSQQRAKVNVIRKIKTATRINADYEIYWAKYVEDKNKRWDILESKDWNMVFRYMIFNNMPWATTIKSIWVEDTYSWNWGTRFDGQKHTDIRSDNSYCIWEDLHEIYEIHTDKTLQVFIDGEEFGFFSRLWPRKEKPVYKLSFRNWLNGLYDIGAGMLAYPYHKVIDSFLNLRLDNDRLAASQPVLVNSDETAFDGFDHIDWYPWKILKFKDVEKWFKNPGISSNSGTIANSEVDLLGKTVQDAVGISGYKMWIQQKVERSAKWVNELVESADATMKSFVESIAKAKWFISKYVVLLALEYMDEETLEKMSGISNLAEWLDMTDFIHNYSFNFNILSVSSLRERQEIELLKNTIKDYAQTTRLSWTPVLNQEEAFKEILDKTRLSSKLFLSADDAFSYMKDQITKNAELKKIESASNPTPVGWETPTIINPNPAIWWGAAPAPWVQWGSQWAEMATSPNNLWNNQIAW